jgi:acyl dehydratase
MRLSELLPAGERREIGTYHFDADKIMDFANKFDPQYFHTDAERAKDSVFGGLCASGWHVCAAIMRANVDNIVAQAKAVAKAGGTPPKLGPAPGIRNLKWLKPVFAGDTIRIFMRFNSDRPVPSRPGRFIADLTYEAENEQGEIVTTFDCSVVEFE